MRAEYPHNQFCCRLKCPNLLGHLFGLQVLSHCLYLRPLQGPFHSLGLTNGFTPPPHSDPLVLANLLRQWQDLSFLTSGIPFRPFQEFTIFTDTYTQGWRPNGGFPDFGFWTRSDRKLHFKILELKAVNLPLHQWVSGHQLMITTDNTIVVAYINKQGGTHSHTLLHLVVNLFLWLQTQDIAIGTRHILGCLHVWADTNSPMVATHNCGFHIYYVFVWTTLSSFHTARTYCHKARYVSNGKSCCLRAWCSHAALPSSRIFEEVTRLAAAPRRPSTNTVYDDRWLHFAHWAAGQRIDPLGPTAVQIAPFLYYLFDTEGLSPQSIKGQQVLFSLSP